MSLLAVFAVAGVLLLANKPDSINGSVITAAQIRASLIACQQEVTDLSCARDYVQALAGTSTATRAALLETTDRMITGNQDIGMDCHRFNHMIGDGINPVTEDLKAYEKYFDRCGRGLIHGIVETVDMSGGIRAAAAAVTSTCTSLSRKFKTLSSAFDPVGDCWHPIGHGIYESQKDLVSGLQICHLAAPETDNARFECSLAVFMSFPYLRGGQNLDEPINEQLNSDGTIVAIERFCSALDGKVGAITPGELPGSAASDACYTIYTGRMVTEKSPLADRLVERCAVRSDRTVSGCVNEVATFAGNEMIRANTSLDAATTERCKLTGRLQACLLRIGEIFIDVGRLNADQALAKFGPKVTEVAPDLELLKERLASFASIRTTN